MIITINDIKQQIKLCGCNRAILLCDRIKRRVVLKVDEPKLYPLLLSKLLANKASHGYSITVSKMSTIERLLTHKIKLIYTRIEEV